MDYDVVIIGAGAAGLMAGAVAGQNGSRVLIIDHADKPGQKIRISGGGRCNFTNLYSAPKNFISQNPHFCKSALAGYTPQDFVTLVNKYKIAWHEKQSADIQHGQLFCDGKSQQIIDMLLTECKAAGAAIWMKTACDIPVKTEAGFSIKTSRETITAKAVIVACGGPSIPKMGATGFGYKIAQAFDIPVTDTRPALVPLTFTGSDADAITALAGTALPVRASFKKTAFNEAMLFTHRGLSGPAILQISSYLPPGESLHLDMLPGTDVAERLKAARQSVGKQSPAKFLAALLPARLADSLAADITAARIGDMTGKAAAALADAINRKTVKPAGTEGYRKAEVTLGGVDTRALNSKTMEAKSVPGLYFIGEVVDVTGHLGGHNFQWAWSSAVSAGKALAKQATTLTKLH